MKQKKRRLRQGIFKLRLKPHPKLRVATLLNLGAFAVHILRRRITQIWTLRPTAGLRDPDGALKMHPVDAFSERASWRAGQFWWVNNCRKASVFCFFFGQCKKEKGKVKASFFSIFFWTAPSRSRFGRARGAKKDKKRIN